MLAASWMIGHGVSSRSSHSWAAGRTTVSAKSCTHFSIWSWSSLRSRENSGIATPPPRSVQEPEPTKLPNGNIARGVGKETRPPVRSAAMRALAYGADGSFAVVDRPDPEPGPGMVVVAVERCGICGSDLHLKASRLLPAGAVIGHEFAGTIAATGDGVAGRRVGDRVAVLPMARFGTGDPCRRGTDQLGLDQAGTAATPQVALNEVRSGGEVVLVGVAGPMDPISLLGIPWVVKEVDFHPCFAYTTEEFGEAVDAVAAGALDAASLASDVRPLDAADAAFTELVQPDGPVKVLLAPGG